MIISKLSEANRCFHEKKFDEVIEICDLFLDTYSAEFIDSDYLYEFFVLKYRSLLSIGNILEIEKLLSDSNILKQILLENFTKLAEVYLDGGNFDKAEDCLDKALFLSDKKSNFLLLKGRVYSKKSDYEKALECFKKALLHLDLISMNIGKICLKLDYVKTYNSISSTLFKLERYEEGYFYALEAKKIIADNLEALSNISYYYYVNQEFSQALKVIDRILSIDHMNFFAISSKAKIYFVKEEFKYSLRYIKELYKNFDDVKEEYVFLALKCLDNIKDNFKKLNHCDELCGYSGKKEFLMKKIEILESLSLSDELMICYNEFKIKISDDRDFDESQEINKKFLLSIAKLQSKSNLDLAIKILDSALREKNDEKLCLLKAQILIKQGNYKDAIEISEFLIRNNKNLGEAYIAKSEAEFFSGDVVGALRTIDFAMQILPDFNNLGDYMAKYISQIKEDAQDNHLLEDAYLQRKNSVETTYTDQNSCSKTSVFSFLDESEESLGDFSEDSKLGLKDAYEQDFVIHVSYSYDIFPYSENGVSYILFE